MSGTFQLDNELFPTDPLTKRWTRQRVATGGEGQGVFVDLWRLDLRFGILSTTGESDFFMEKFLAGGLHSAVLPHPESGALTSFTGVAISNYTFTFNDVDRDSYADNPSLSLSSIPVARL